MPNSFFHFKKFSIQNQSKGLKVTTDACLLGALSATDSNPNSILDIGTGTGVIALMLAQRFPKTNVDAIELDEQVYNQAFQNFESSIFNNQIKCYLGNYLTFECPRKYDLIVCNPPYFTHRKSSALDLSLNAEKTLAMHNLSLPFAALCQKTHQDLSQNGEFALILPPLEMKDFIQIALNSKWYVKRQIDIYNGKTTIYRQVLVLKSKKTLQEPTENLTIQENGVNTASFRRLMNEFYLENTEKYKRNPKD